MFKIFEIRGKRFEYSNNIRAQKLSNPNPNIRDSRKKIRIRIESEYIRSPLIVWAECSPGFLRRHVFYLRHYLFEFCLLLKPNQSSFIWGCILSCESFSQIVDRERKQGQYKRIPLAPLWPAINCRYNINTDVFSLLSDPKVSPVPVSKGQPKVVLASRAGRLLRSVRLLMAREKSYDVSQGRGSGRGSAPAATRWVSCT